eukprot:TRINITY_DN2064_c0_g1_i1.p1 TRINITY_DN2064_c0_g1~~TRINITY_DN2064_c0_g1_i1.p1  ORF type:complete len:251 (-),score=65.55 TRINITY_DN2064_c0_g1_i1:23-775(-)
MIQTQTFSSSFQGSSHSTCWNSPNSSTYPSESKYQTALRVCRSFEEEIQFSFKMKEDLSCTTGDSFKIQDLSQETMRNIIEIMNPHNVCLFLRLATRYQLSNLEGKCHLFIARNPTAVLSSEAFRLCDEETLIALLGPNSRLSSILDEILILEALVRWAETRLKSLGIEADDESVAKQLRFILDSAHLPNLKSSLSPRKKSLSNSPTLEDSPLESGEILMSSSPFIVSFLVGSYELTFDCQNGTFVPLSE